MGNNLIFLISQPRAGSTLTQKMLGSHPMIHTQSEPWVMLHPLHALKPDGLVAEYDASLYAKGLEDFIRTLPGGRSQYVTKMAEVYRSFYTGIATSAGKPLFLDKTPRYYLIIPELAELFPDARFIFLWRNPMAVLGSIVNTWVKRDWYRLSEFKYDLLHAPELMLQGRTLLSKNAYHIQYEQLLASPEATLQAACQFLDIPFEPEMIEYGNKQSAEWQYGDKGTVNEKSRPDQQHAEQWHKSLNDPQHWRVMHEYLLTLGEEKMEQMGYSYSDTEQALSNHKPDVDIEKNSVPLQQLTDNTARTMLEYKKAMEWLKQRDVTIKQKNEEIKRKDELLRLKDEELSQKNNRLKYKREVIEKKEEELLTAKRDFYRFRKSGIYKIWRTLTWPLRKLKNNNN